MLARRFVCLAKGEYVQVSFSRKTKKGVHDMASPLVHKSSFMLFQ
jgi:hypothetical protein